MRKLITLLVGAALSGSRMSIVPFTEIGESDTQTGNAKITLSEYPAAEFGDPTPEQHAAFHQFQKDVGEAIVAAAERGIPPDLLADAVDNLDWLSQYDGDFIGHMKQMTAQIEVPAETLPARTPWVVQDEGTLQNEEPQSAAEKPNRPAQQ